MKVLWLNWKDSKNPHAGGAEVVTHELAKRLVQDGHEVILLTAGFEGAPDTEVQDGIIVIRVGGRWSVYLHAFLYYKKHLKNWPDLVIDEVNTIPFFAKFYTKTKNILFVHQLCREIWFYQMFFPLNIIGYIAEPIYLWLLRNQKVITVSESTKKDLMKFGFKKENIDIISEGITITPLARHPREGGDLVKTPNPSILSLGAFREMKRTDHIVKAFEIAKKDIPNLELILAGDSTGTYAQKVLKAINNSEYSHDIKYAGRVDDEFKIHLYQSSHLIAVTSVKEGWGLIVTEANSQGLPAVVYNVDGLRDSVRDGVTGLITKQNTPEALAREIVILLKDKNMYDTMSNNAWEWSRGITFERSYGDFLNAITK